jgi:hypothetical protein
MSIKSKVLAAAATLAVIGGVSTAGTLSASAATPGCSQNGNTCVQIFSKRFGTPASPGFVESAFLGLPFAGVPTILQRTSTSNPAGDIIIPAAGTVSQFYAKGMVSAAVNSHYGAEKAVQVEYAPRGVPTGLCAAIATATPYQDEGLTLQPCTTPGTTVFIIDTADSPATAPVYFPIVLASTTDFAHPFTMTFPGQADPAHRLFPQIKVQHLMGNPANVPDDQLWGADIPPVS